VFHMGFIMFNYRIFFFICHRDKQNGDPYRQN
jgi:hypothetical protein